MVRKSIMFQILLTWNGAHLSMRRGLDGRPQLHMPVVGTIFPRRHGLISTGSLSWLAFQSSLYQWALNVISYLSFTYHHGCVEELADDIT
jgi:hypothetical protein